MRQTLLKQLLLALAGQGQIEVQALHGDLSADLRYAETRSRGGCEMARFARQISGRSRLHFFL